MELILHFLDVVEDLVLQNARTGVHLAHAQYQHLVAVFPVCSYPNHTMVMTQSIDLLPNNRHLSFLRLNPRFLHLVFRFL